MQLEGAEDQGEVAERLRGPFPARRGAGVVATIPPVGP
jgi:hypothetical protein